MSGYAAIRCGWCLDGNHDHCAVVINLSQGAAHKVYRCPCDCNTTGAYTPEHPRTRCVECGRRDVPTDHTDRCTDRDDCADHIARRRAASPAWQQLEKARSAKLASENKKGTAKMTDATETVRERKARLKAEGQPSRSEVKPKEPGQCRCCSGQTKGGSFLPGHDARYVSQQADLIVNHGRQDLLAARLDDLSPHLFAKLTKRIEKLREDNAPKADA